MVLQSAVIAILAYAPTVTIAFRRRRRRAPHPVHGGWGYLKLRIVPCTVCHSNNNKIPQCLELYRLVDIMWTWHPKRDKVRPT